MQAKCTHKRSFFRLLHDEYRDKLQDLENKAMKGAKE